MAWNCFTTDAKCLENFSPTLKRILLNNCLQLFVVKTPLSSSTLFIFKGLISTTEFWNHFCTVQSHVDLSFHALLILVEVSVACNIRGRRSRFGIFIIEVYVWGIELTSKKITLNILNVEKIYRIYDKHRIIYEFYVKHQKPLIL